MSNPPVIQTQVVADKAKEYGMNKPTIYWQPNKDQAVPPRLPRILGYEPKYL
jgi:hypothetical protein